MTTMLEKLARAVHKAHRTAPYPWWHTDPDRCQVSPVIVRAVLEALKEPSEELRQAASAYHLNTPGSDVLTAMIGAILEEGGDG